MRQLVRARGTATTAVDALHPCDGILHLHTLHKRGDALRVAMATTHETHILDDAVFHRNINKS